MAVELFQRSWLRKSNVKARAALAVSRVENQGWNEARGACKMRNEGRGERAIHAANNAPWPPPAAVI